MVLWVNVHIDAVCFACVATGSVEYCGGAQQWVHHIAKQQTPLGVLQHVGVVCGELWECGGGDACGGGGEVRRVLSWYHHQPRFDDGI